MSGLSDDQRLLPDAVRKLEDEVFILKEYIANELVATDRRNAAVFSDAQMARIEACIATGNALLLGSDAFAKAQDLRLELNAGRQALRFILWLVCSFVAGASSVAVYYFKLH